MKEKSKVQPTDQNRLEVIKLLAIAIEAGQHINAFLRGIPPNIQNAEHEENVRIQILLEDAIEASDIFFSIVNEGIPDLLGFNLYDRPEELKESEKLYQVCRDKRRAYLLKSVGEKEREAA